MILFSDGSKSNNQAHLNTLVTLGSEGFWPVLDVLDGDGSKHTIFGLESGSGKHPSTCKNNNHPCWCSPVISTTSFWYTVMWGETPLIGIPRPIQINIYGLSWFSPSRFPFNIIKLPLLIIAASPIFMHTYAYICIHMHTYAYICIHMHTYAYICIHLQPWVVESFSFDRNNQPTSKKYVFYKLGKHHHKKLKGCHGVSTISSSSGASMIIASECLGESGAWGCVSMVLFSDTAFCGTLWTSEHPKHVAGWWFGTRLLFSHMLGIIIPIDFHIFRRGSNHQPVLWCSLPLGYDCWFGMYIQVASEHGTG